jgi:hypothetical protein
MAVAYSYAHCAPHVGKWVVCHTTSGVYRGVLQRVTHQGIYLAQARAVAVSSDANGLQLEHAQNRSGQSAQAEPTWWWPAVFIPFWALLWFSLLVPFLWW